MDDAVKLFAGEVVGDAMEYLVGAAVGEAVGEALGISIVDTVGEAVKEVVGLFAVDVDLGDDVGLFVGDGISIDDGLIIGDPMGELVGLFVGFPGESMGVFVRKMANEVNGVDVENFVGEVVDWTVGESVPMSAMVIA